MSDNRPKDALPEITKTTAKKIRRRAQSPTEPYPWCRECGQYHDPTGNNTPNNFVGRL